MWNVLWPEGKSTVIFSSSIFLTPDNFKKMMIFVSCDSSFICAQALCGNYNAC